MNIALAVVLITVIVTAGLALAVYQLQSGSAMDRFVNSAITGFSSDIDQARQRTVDCGPEWVPNNCRVHQVREYMKGRLGISWALVRLPPEGMPEGDSQSIAQDDSYRPVAGNTGWTDGQLPVDEIDEARTRLVTYPYDGGDGSYIVVARALARGIVLVEYYSTAQLDQEMSTLRTQLAIIGVLGALAAASAGVLAARRIQRPVRIAANAARELGGGALDTRLPVRGHDELADLATSFNAMAERLGDSIEQLQRKDEQQRRFVADVAHDLRTPLASLTAATDGLHSPDAADRSRSAELLGTQIRRLSTLVEDLLEISRFDAGVVELMPERVDLTELVADAVALAAPESTITTESSGDVVVHGDPRRLHTVVRNLLTNAVNHGAPPVTVTVDGSSRDQVTVAVADSGAGLPAEVASQVFDRFVRGDRARGQTSGSGLGLAIAQQNAALHGGVITVHNAGGAVFTLVLSRSPNGRAIERDDHPSTC